MPVEDLVNVAKDDLVLAFHSGWHRYLLLLYQLHVSLHSTSISTYRYGGWNVRRDETLALRFASVTNLQNMARYNDLLDS